MATGKANAGEMLLDQEQQDRAAARAAETHYSGAASELGSSPEPQMGEPPPVPHFDPEKMKYTKKEWERNGAAALLVGLVGLGLYKGNGYLAGAMFGGAMKAMMLGEHEKAQNYLNGYHAQLQAAHLAQEDYWKRYQAVMRDNALNFDQKVAKLKALAAEFSADADLAALDSRAYEGYQEHMLRRHEIVTEAAARAQNAKDKMVGQFVMSMRAQKRRVDAMLADAEDGYKRWASFSDSADTLGRPVNELKQLEESGWIDPGADFFHQTSQWGVAPLGSEQGQKASEKFTVDATRWFNTGRTLSTSIHLLRAVQGQIEQAIGRTRATGEAPIPVRVAAVGPIPMRPPHGQGAAKPTDIQYLMAHPEKAQNFYNEFGYLPEGFMKKFAPEPIEPAGE